MRQSIMTSIENPLVGLIVESIQMAADHTEPKIADLFKALALMCRLN